MAYYSLRIRTCRPLEPTSESLSLLECLVALSSLLTFCRSIVTERLFYCKSKQRELFAGGNV